MKGKITARAVEALRKQANKNGSDVFLWDTELQGFGAKASAHGRVSWVFQHWLGGRGGKAKRIAFGQSPPMGVDEARKEAEKLRGEVNSGVDIVDRKQQLREAKREALLATALAEAVETYFQKRSKPGRFWSELRTRFDNEIVPALGKDTKLAGITKADIRHLIQAKEDTHPVAARTMFEALRPFFKWCVERDIIAASPMQNLKAPPLPASRDRILTDAEITAFWKAAGELPLFGPCHRLLLLTAQRREEVGAMSWSELDLEQATWIIPGSRTKNGKEHLVHLSFQAVAILSALPKLASPFVFTTTLEAPISGYGHAKARLDELIKPDKPWRVHDLRRTAASGMASLGFLPHIIERVLNHTSGATGGLISVYQRYEYAEERKRAIEAWGNYVDKLVAGKRTADNVVSLVRA